MTELLAKIPTKYYLESIEIAVFSDFYCPPEIQVFDLILFEAAAGSHDVTGRQFEENVDGKNFNFMLSLILLAIPAEQISQRSSTFMFEIRFPIVHIPF